MQLLKSKTGLINIVICILIVLTVVLLFVPSISYDEEKEDVSVYTYVLFPAERTYKNVGKYLEEVNPDYKVNDIYAEPMLLLVVGVVAVIICFAGYKHWISAVAPIIWGFIGIRGAASNILMRESSLNNIYMIIPIVVIGLAAIGFVLNTAFQKKA